MSKIKIACLLLALALLIVVVVIQLNDQRSAVDDWQSVNLEMENTLNRIETESKNNSVGEQSAATPQETNVEPQKNHKISINSATLEQLDSLPGIGPSKAKAIIDYRTKHGEFRTLEQIMDVKGIGPKTFENMKELISLSPQP